jgi:thioester reductase-like protein
MIGPTDPEAATPHDGAPLANDPLAAATSAALRAAVRDHARAYLPDAMVPAHLVVLDRLPTLPNGKTDRAALPAPDRTDAAAVGYLAPRTDRERQLAEIWRDVLGLDRVGVHDDFFTLGGDSLAAVRMAARVRERCGGSVSLRRVFDHPTIAGLAAVLDAATGTGTAPPATGGDARSLDPDALRAEAVLPGGIVPAAGPVAVPPYRDVLVTGGTGYTGAFLLRELLDRSGADIHVLVRPGADGDPAGRVRRAMAAYGLWRVDDAARLLCVAGDLGRPYLGLAPATYRRLAERVDLIVHNGASSNYALPYHALKPVNVLGTQEVLRFACAGRTKPVHAVSTLGVFPRPSGEPTFAEVEVTEPDDVLGGYRQSKWVAERLVATAAARGVPACVYRPGYIIGAARTGAGSADTFLSTVLRGCVALGATTASDSPLELVPVDFFAAAVAEIALSGRGHGSWFNLPGARPLSWDAMFDLVAGCGYAMRRVEYPEWYELLLRAGESNPLHRFLPTFDGTGMSSDLIYPDCRPVYGTARLAEALAGTGIRCPEVDGPVMAAQLRYLATAGGTA